MSNVINDLKEVICPYETLLTSASNTKVGAFDENYKWVCKTFSSSYRFHDHFHMKTTDLKEKVFSTRYPKILNVLNSTLSDGDDKYTEANLDYAFSKMERGDTLQVFVELCNKRMMRDSGWKYSSNPVDKHLGTIGKVYIYRIPENTNTNTFDYIKVDSSIVGVDDKTKFLKEHKGDITRRVLSKIAKSKDFKAFGVPVNILRLTSLTITKHGLVYFTFEPKELV